MPRPSVREKLIETASDKFHTLGFNGCGVQEITEAAGIPKGSFYSHFKSKELLLIEVIERYAASKRFDMLDDQTVPPLERLRAHFAFLEASCAANKFRRGCLLGNLSTEMAGTNPLVREALDHALGRWSDAVARVLREAQASGSLSRAHHPEILARFLVNAWEGATARMKVLASGAPLEDFFAVTFGTLLR